MVTVDGWTYWQTACRKHRDTHAKRSPSHGTRFVIICGTTTCVAFQRNNLTLAYSPLYYVALRRCIPILLTLSIRKQCAFQLNHRESVYGHSALSLDCAQTRRRYVRTGIHRTFLFIGRIRYESPHALVREQEGNETKRINRKLTCSVS